MRDPQQTEHLGLDLEIVEGATNALTGVMNDTAGHNAQVTDLDVNRNLTTRVIGTLDEIEVAAAGKRAGADVPNAAALRGLSFQRYYRGHASTLAYTFNSESMGRTLLAKVTV